MAHRYTLETAPAWIAPPHRDERGRAIRCRSRTLICQHGHGDDHLLFYARRQRYGRPSGSWECRLCRNAAQAIRNQQRRQGDPTETARPVADPPLGGWTRRNPFDFTRVQLEAAWGPYRSWTRAQHLEHTRRMYDFLGWGPEAVRGPVVGRQPASAAAEVAA